MDYPDNLISDYKDPFQEWVDAEPKAGNWPPFPVYDMVQCGYPRSDHGMMVQRTYSGSDENGHLLPPKGMWCKVEDAMARIDDLETTLRMIALSLGVGGLTTVAR